MSLDFEAELALTRFKGKKNTLRREFVLPDYVHHFRGQIRDPNAAAPPAAAPAGAAPAPAPSGPPSKKAKKEATSREVTEQVLTLANERICVPELLFRPSDIGIDQAGMAECVVQASASARAWRGKAPCRAHPTAPLGHGPPAGAGLPRPPLTSPHLLRPRQAVDACLPDLRESLYSNIVLTGGSSLFPNFQERLQRELRSLVPADYEIGVTPAKDALHAAWRGGSLFASAENFQAQTVTRAEYHEHGHALCRRRFLA